MALGVVLVNVLLFVGGAIHATLPWQHDSHAYRQALSTPSSLAAMLVPLLCTAALVAALAWALARGRLELAPQSVTQPGRVFWTFMVVYVMLCGIDIYILSSHIQQFRAAIWSWLGVHGIYLLRARIGWMTLIISLTSLAISVLIVLVACQVALRVGQPGNAGASAPRTDTPARHTVPVACGVFFVSVQWLLQNAFNGWMDVYQHVHGLLALASGVVGPLLVFGLAFTGARMGAGAPRQARPLRALAAALLTLTLQHAICIAIGVGWLMWAMHGASTYFIRVSDLIGPVMLMAALYALLLVFFMRLFTRLFYRRLQ
ncbi:MAG TPA: hypothetical protein VFR20_11155 [Burkholderiaceae bacterium]|nr:hypothetical protein [Burkholderiaceae bacterium]